MDLISIPANPVPDGAIVTTLTAQDGVNLRVARWEGRPTQRGTVVILAGRAEFIERYFETVAELLARGFAVVALDWRGQGLSERQLRNSRKGHIDDFEIYERDLVALRDQILTPLCPKPWFALGHSMGAAVLLAQAHAGRSPFARLVLTSPMIDLYLLRFKAGARLFIEGLDIIGLGGSYIPGASGRSIYLRPFAQQVLTSDETRYARTVATLNAAPQLAIGGPTVSWANAALRLMRQFENPDYARRTLTPALVIAVGADRIVATPAIEAFASRLKAGHFITLPQARHDILMERDVFRSQFWAAFDAFIPGAEDEMAKTLRAAPPRRRRRGLLRWPLAARV
ncbi:MAG: alpha/beta hydrolase [Methylovirgula sp.]|uniref:alpha/beta hydrolase n=1 Tax=Methylovirgula sp. TaxID=1978224 RepID=UPI0030760CC0